MKSATEALLVTVIVLALGAGAVLAFGGAAQAPEPTPKSFQELVGGLGTGPAVHPARCGLAFDRPVAGSCSWRHGAVAGGDRYCPLHAAFPEPAPSPR